MSHRPLTLIQSTPAGALGSSAARARDTFADVMHLLGLPASVMAQAAGAEAAATAVAAMPVAVRRVRALSPLFVEGAPADALFLVRLGTFKSVRVDPEGYEQVLGFDGRGELLGPEALGGLPYATSAVALEDSEAWVLPLADLQALRRQLPAFDQALQRALVRQLRHAGDMAELMNAVAAEVRLARFFVHESARMVAMGHSGRRLLLRMTRRDIASYLGLAHETVSRALSLLTRSGCVRVDHRDVEITDPDALGACARCTRGRSVLAAAAATPATAEPARLAA